MSYTRLIKKNYFQKFLFSEIHFQKSQKKVGLG
jgi:hypothetical protein